MRPACSAALLLALPAAFALPRSADAAAEPVAAQTVAAPPLEAAANRPVWPDAVHLEGSYSNVACSSSGAAAPVCVPGIGTVVWDTLGSASKPASSLSYEARRYTETLPGSPPSGVASTAWELCPSRTLFGNNSLTNTCMKRPVPCIHRFDPISAALFACKDWHSIHQSGLTHYSSSKCNFQLFPIPGVKTAGASSHAERCRFQIEAGLFR